jgi:toxin ParE1/3/4
MPDKHSVQYLPVAQNDLVAILDWIAKDSPARAVAFVDTVAKRIGRLESHPSLGRMPRHEKLKQLGYRILIVDRYLVFYVLRGQNVEIHRVLHGSRQLDDIL